MSIKPFAYSATHRSNKSYILGVVVEDSIKDMFL